ncbi:enoyl-CoA hydratase-related protein [Staphylospora marina]|uniref:enoyl-CoA hydratase-related protein n=1 Tax=Staphylospora marina TaxID=2490858 RepID=UPI000F5B8C68|nr:enoyl-CoA hydratase-related protein [Staphylospora marina]
MSEKTVILERVDGVGIIRLNRPRVYNAVNDQMGHELLQTLRQVRQDPEIRAVVLTGEGKAFCSGQDLNDRSTVREKGETFSLGESVRNRYNPIIREIAGMEKPVIAAVNGVAAGAGASMAFACDFRFIVPETRFIQAFVRIGLVPDSGSSYFLPKLVGLGRALEIAMTGRDVGAEEAVSIGLANRVIPGEQLMDETLEFAKKLAEGPTVALGLIKKAMYRGAEASLEEILEMEAEFQEQAGRTEDYLEGVRAFTEKRKPVYRGR